MCHKVVPLISTAILYALVRTSQAQPPGEDLLAKVRAKVRDNVNRLSNYACTETVERKVYSVRRGEISPKACEARLEDDRGGRLTSSDRLRLDVGASKPGHEMYSWAGEKRFEAKIPAELIGGMNSRGSFAGALRMVFNEDHVTISYRGESREGTQELARYEFKASREQSDLRYMEAFSVVTAYEGTFLVDPNTFDVVRLTIHHMGLPATASACAMGYVLDYQNVRVQDAMLLLPAVGRMVAIYRNGTKAVNQTLFSDCREFVGQSAVHFGGEPGKNASPQPAPKELDVARNRQFEIAFTQDVDTRTAAAGDTTRCELATPIRDGEKIVAPRGAPVTARILELTRNYRGRSSVKLTFRVESVLVDGTTWTLRAHPKPSTEGEQPKSRGVRWSIAANKLTATIGPKGDLAVIRGVRSEWLTGE